MASLSPEASNRKLERMGMVVLRSTTPWVAVSSLSKSDLLMVISIVDPASVPAEEDIVFRPPNNIGSNLSQKQIYTAVTVDACGKVEIGSNSLTLGPLLMPIQV